MVGRYALRGACMRLYVLVCACMRLTSVFGAPARTYLLWLRTVSIGESDCLKKSGIGADPHDTRAHPGIE